MRLVVLTTSLVVLGDVTSFLDLFSKDFSPFLLIVLVALVILTVLFVWSRRVDHSRSVGTTDRTSIVLEGSIAARPVLSKAEAILYNLIQLAVQDSYLVFAKLPLSNFITVTEEDEDTRKTMLRAIRSARVDVVLVHPGTLYPAKVITYSVEPNRATQRTDQEQLLDALMQSAGLEVVHLETQTTYSVPKLIEILGLKEEE